VVLMTGQRVDVLRPLSVLDGMSFLAGERFDLDPLPGGLTNRNYRVQTASGGDFVARFSGAKSDMLAIDRDAEAHNSRVAAGIGVGPGVVDYAPDRGVLVVDWIEGRTLRDADLGDLAMLERLAATCRELHAGPRFANDFDMFDIQRRYLHIVREHGFRLPADYLEFEPQVHVLDELLHASGTGTVACHNDLLAANVMDDGERIWFIDYEYSGNNDPCFELGNIWSEANLPEEHLDHLVSSYYGERSPARNARARLFALMSKYGWTLWASIQDAVSDVDFDFWEWGMEKYARAVAEFRSPTFDRLTEAVRQSINEGAKPWPTPSS
jgi:thiamine kinase-like enzyme